MRHLTLDYLHRHNFPPNSVATDCAECRPSELDQINLEVPSLPTCAPVCSFFSVSVPLKRYDVRLPLWLRTPHAFGKKKIQVRRALIVAMFDPISSRYDV